MYTQFRVLGNLGEFEKELLRQTITFIALTSLQNRREFSRLQAVFERAPHAIAFDTHFHAKTRTFYFDIFPHQALFSVC